MNSALVIQALTLLNTLISLTSDSQKYRDIIAKSIAEGRDITETELDESESAAFAAIEDAKS
jgi:hypothetical protein